MTPRRTAILLAVCLFAGAAALGWARAPKVPKRLRDGQRNEVPSHVARLAMLRFDRGTWRIESQAQRGLWIDEVIAVATTASERVRSSPEKRLAVPGAARASWPMRADLVRTAVRLSALSDESASIEIEHDRWVLDRRGRPLHANSRSRGDISPGVVQALSDDQDLWPGLGHRKLGNDMMVLAMLERGTDVGAPWTYANWEARIVANAEHLSRAVTAGDTVTATPLDIRSTIALVAALRPTQAAPYVADIADADTPTIDAAARAAAQIAAVACGATGRDEALDTDGLSAGWDWLGRALGSRAAPFHWYLDDGANTAARDYVISLASARRADGRHTHPRFADLFLQQGARQRRMSERPPSSHETPSLPLRLLGLLAITGAGLLIWRRPPALAPRTAARMAWAAPLLIGLSAVVPGSIVERLLGAACLALAGVVVHAVGRACRVPWTAPVLVAFLLAAGLRLLPPLVDLSLAGWFERAATFGALVGTLAVGFAAQPPAVPRLPAHPRPNHGVIRRDVGLIVVIAGLFGANAGLNYVRIFTGGSKPRELSSLLYLSCAVIVMSAVLLQDRLHAPVRGRPIAVLERDPVRITGVGWLGVIVLGATHVYAGVQSLAGGLCGLPATHADDAFVTSAAVGSAGSE